MKENKELNLKEEISKLDEVLSIYRNIYSATSVMVESITQLGRLDLMDRDIQKINKTYDNRSTELFSIVGELEEFKKCSNELLDKLI